MKKKTQLINCKSVEDDDDKRVRKKKNQMKQENLILGTHLWMRDKKICCIIYDGRDGDGVQWKKRLELSNGSTRVEPLKVISRRQCRIVEFFHPRHFSEALSLYIKWISSLVLKVALRDS